MAKARQVIPYNFTLPGAFARSFMPLGDSQTSGFLALAPVGTLANNVTPGGTANQIDNYTDLTTYSASAAAIRNNIYRLGDKINSLGASRFAYGSTGDGAYRSHLFELVMNLGIEVPTYGWMRGSFQSTDPNLVGGGGTWDRFQAVPGYTCLSINSAFAGWWVQPFAADAIVLMCGTNDWVGYLNANPGDYVGAASYMATNLATLLATIKSVAGPDVVVMFVTPPTGVLHKASALLSVPLVSAVIDSARDGGQKVYLGYDASTAFAPPVGFSTNLMADLSHLNDIGNRMLAGGILRGMLASPF